jgi:large subunit ribosomal protein L10
LKKVQAMPTPKKNETIARLTDMFNSANGIFLTDSTGLKVELVTNLRKRCAAENIGFMVVKNTLARRAAKAAGLPDLDKWFTGPTAVAYSKNNPAGPVKILRAFVREVREANGKLEIKKGVVDGQVIDDAQMQMLADLPTPEVVRARFLGLLQAPASQFVGILSAGPASLVRALDQRRQQLDEQAAGSTAGSTEAPTDAPAGQ